MMMWPVCFALGAGDYREPTSGSLERIGVNGSLNEIIQAIVVTTRTQSCIP
ncbi:MAG: hypothetical protein PWP11_2654 [Thauera sp.]|nr:hypothetical protein [Thauera sp.]